MLKICGKLFTSYLQFVVRRHKINGKHPVKNYRPISTPRLLHIFLLNFVIQNYRISSAQSDFKPIDSCINQLLSIIHETNHSTDEVRSYEVMKFEVYFLIYPKHLKKYDKKVLFSN